MSTTDDTAPPGTELVAVETTAGQIPAAAEPGRATYADVTAEAGQRKPIVAEHWRRDKIRGTVTDRLSLIGYRVLWQLARVHITVPVMLAYAVKGALVLIGRVVIWWHVPHLRVLESAGVAKGGKEGHSEAMRAHERGLKTRGGRGRILAVCAVGFAAAVTATLAYAPWWALPAAGLAAVPLLARHGSGGKPLLGAAVIPARFEPPTFELIARALADAVPTIKAAVKAGKNIDFLIDVHPDGPGWGCVLNLPRGITATEVVKRRAELSAAGHWPLSATWPSGVPETHEGQLDLWIGKQDLAKMKQPPWPLLKAGAADVFGSFPLGTNPRGQRIDGTLFEHNWLVGSLPGQGKTATMRVIGCAAALDPLCELWVHEMAGKGDLEALARVSHRYVSGLDDESVAYAAESLAKLRKELDRRSTALKKLPKEMRPHGKVTREMARNRGLHLYPIVAIFDEVQNVFTHPEHGKQAADDAGYVIRLGRAYGVMLELGTQRPTSDMIPAAVSGNVSSRFCLKVPSYRETDLVLGTGSSNLGYKAEVFRAKTDAGMGWMKAEGEPQIVRTYYLDLPATERIIARAHAVRVKAGTLTGFAAGQAEDTEARSFIRDVATAFGGEDKLWLESIASRLSERIPEAYDGVTAEAVASQLRAIDPALVKKVREPGREPRAGAERSAVEESAGALV